MLLQCELKRSVKIMLQTMPRIAYALKRSLPKRTGSIRPLPESGRYHAETADIGAAVTDAGGEGAGIISVPTFVGFLHP